MTEKIEFPIRINRYLALQGLATRRSADELIVSGAVYINGQKAQLGDRVQSADKVDIIRSKKQPAKAFAYVAYYKPRGIITHSPQEEERAIKDISPFPELAPLGRLDKASEGLILLTDDGRVTDRLLHPRFAHEKEYLATVREKVLPSVKMLLETGIESEGDHLAAKKIQILGAHTIIIVLTEGKKHQIRRMLDAAHLTVEKLVRTRIMGVHLGALKPGQSRILKGSARASFLKSIDLQENV
ncbi:MAG: pseudouridine synthase [Candidatus Moraniibacteriota bacterium]